MAFYSLPLDQTNLHIHQVEVLCTFSGLEPEPDIYDVDYTQEDLEAGEDPFFKRDYCYLVVGDDDENLSKIVSKFVREDDPGWDLYDVCVQDVISCEISNYNQVHHKIEGDQGRLIQDAFIRLWGEPQKNNIFILDDRLFVPDPTLTIFPAILDFGWEKLIPEELVREFESNEIQGFQIHDNLPKVG